MEKDKHCSWVPSPPHTPHVATHRSGASLSEMRSREGCKEFIKRHKRWVRTRS